jgi:hypothetical protein
MLPAANLSARANRVGRGRGKSLAPLSFCLAARGKNVVFNIPTTASFDSRNDSPYVISTVHFLAVFHCNQVQSKFEGVSRKNGSPVLRTTATTYDGKEQPTPEKEEIC